MNIPRITWKRFFDSRFLPWTLVILLLGVSSAGGFYGKILYEERETLRQEITSISRTLSMTEYQLKQEQNSEKNTIKTREEIRPDGTKIVESESSEENTKTNTQSEGSERQSTEVLQKNVTETTKEVKEERVSAPSYSVSGSGVLPLSLPPLGYEYRVGVGVRLGGLPFWLDSGVYLDNNTLAPARFDLGIRWEF